MKKIVLWLCAKYGIPTEKVIEKETIKYVTAGTVEGDLFVDGDLIVNGTISATNNIVCLKNKEI